MTEGEWLAGGRPEPLLAELATTLTDRQLRLFVCACCRHIWHLLPDRRLQLAVELAERYAEGQCNDAELVIAHAAAQVAAEVDDAEKYVAGNAATVASQPHVTLEDAIDAAEDAANAIGFGGHSAYQGEQRHQAMLVRAIVGNPFRPVVIDPGWRTPDVRALADHIDRTRNYVDLPKLADALSAVGCAEPTVLAACKTRGPFVPGFWVLDRLLGR
jgi:hypothetical protein